MARKQAARFPWEGDGLGVTERAALRALHRGPAAVEAVLGDVGAEVPAYGWTDVQVGAELAALGRGRTPLEAGRLWRWAPATGRLVAGRA